MRTLIASTLTLILAISPLHTRDSRLLRSKRRCVRLRNQIAFANTCVCCLQSRTQSVQKRASETPNGFGLDLPSGASMHRSKSSMFSSRHQRNVSSSSSHQRHTKLCSRNRRYLKTRIPVMRSSCLPTMHTPVMAMSQHRSSMSITVFLRTTNSSRSSASMCVARSS